EDASSGPYHGLAVAKNIPCDSQAGSEVVDVRRVPGSGKAATIIGVADKHQARRRGGNDFRVYAGSISVRPELLGAAIDFLHDELRFPAKAHGDRKVRPGLPLIFGKEPNHVLPRVRVVSRRLVVAMQVPHHETCQPEVRQDVGELPVAVLKIGIPDVGLVALIIAAEAKGVASVRPGGLIADLVGGAGEPAVGEVAQAEV